VVRLDEAGGILPVTEWRLRTAQGTLRRARKKFSSNLERFTHRRRIPVGLGKPFQDPASLGTALAL
jgi:hypothetical protein